MKDLETLLQDAKDVLDDLNIPYGDIVSCTVNYRATSRWGQCRRVGNNRYEIEISSLLMTDDVEWEAAMNTMIHELLHAHKYRMCHTGEWKRCANIVNREYPIYCIKRCSSAAERGVNKDVLEKYKYKIVCEECGTASYYTRKTKAVTRIMKFGVAVGFYCNKCKSMNLKVEELR